MFFNDFSMVILCSIRISQVFSVVFCVPRLKLGTARGRIPGKFRSQKDMKNIEVFLNLTRYGNGTCMIQIGFAAPHPITVTNWRSTWGIPYKCNNPDSDCLNKKTCEFTDMFWRSREKISGNFQHWFVSPPFSPSILHPSGLTPSKGLDAHGELLERCASQRKNQNKKSSTPKMKKQSKYVGQINGQANKLPRWKENMQLFTIMLETMQMSLF